MESSKKPNFNSPAKIILNNKLEKFCHSTFNSESQFKSFQTPPSKLVKTKNPFDSIINDRLDTHFASPSIFAKSASPKPEDGFKWDIDMLSSIKPAHIDHHTTDQFDTPERNPDVESFAQSRIDKFFSLKVIVPSPYTEPNSYDLILPTEELSTPKSPIFTDNSAQTILSLPPNLPKHVEDVLKPYFSYTKCQEDGVNSFLYRNLFDGGSSNCSDTTSPAKSIDLNLSSIQYSPMIFRSALSNRTSNSPTEDQLKNCELSPVIVNRKNRSKCKYSSQMSVDDSSFTVPDENREVPLDNMSFDNSRISIEDKLSDSTVHWDLEFKKISSPESDYQDEMDISNLNTPKSRIINSQRKKLSDSFPELEEEEEIIEQARTSSANDNFSDLGYQTGCTTTEESTLWSNSHLFASTPTKKNFIRNDMMM